VAQTQSRFWLYDWVDEFEVAGREDADALLRPGSAAVRRLHEIASGEEWGPAQPYSGVGPAILAGRGLDLSGNLDCCHYVCQKRQVDALFGRVLHYFDDIVVSGPPAHKYARDLDDPDEPTLVNIANHVEALVYLREIGAEPLLQFVEKRSACEQHFRQHAQEAGLGDVLAGSREWTQRLAEGGVVEDLREHDDHWHFRFNHPVLEHTAWGVARSSTHDATPTELEVAEAVFAMYTAHLTSDVLTARDLGIPLGAGVRLHEDVLQAHTSKIAPEKVAFDLRLPVFEELPIRDIVKLREDEWEYFERFRHALTVAIQERIDESDSSTDAADRVYLDVIEPSLMDLDRRLRSAERAFAGKVGASLAVGSLTTIVSLLIGAPLEIGLGLAGTASLRAGDKYIEDRRQIELSDMYFLWRLERRSA
jgi:hypothetical protein